MASALFAVSLVCLLSGTSAQADDVKVTRSDRPEKTFVSAKVGDNVTLPCFYGKDGDQWIYWLKQTPGQEPKLIFSFYSYGTDFFSHGEFKSDPRFTLDTKNEGTRLKIKAVELSDSATYLCLKPFYQEVVLQSFSLHVWGSALEVRASLHQSASECLQPGRSLNLSCQVPAEVRDDPQAGNYKCSVLSCAYRDGHSGNRSGLDFGDMAAVALAVILVAVLAVLACIIHKRYRGSNNEPRTGFPAPSTTHEEEPQNNGSIHYAALQKHDTRKSRRPRGNNNDECVYSGINL